MKVRVLITFMGELKSTDIELAIVPQVGKAIDVGEGSVVVTKVDLDAQPITITGDFLAY